MSRSNAIWLPLGDQAAQTESLSAKSVNCCGALPSGLLVNN
jgi:hypothetical protein